MEIDRRIRTDLALELRDDIGHNEDIKGVNVYAKSYEDEKINETLIEVADDEGSEILGKPIGRYVTLESKELRKGDEEIHEPMVVLLHKHLEDMVGSSKKILVVGLGNRGVTSDALGPFTVDNLYITRHLLSEGLVKNVRELSAISPGVMAQTGIESQSILKALCKEINPDIVIAVDALAAREPSRLGSTIQICDTGISPGSGVNNNRMKLTQDTIGVKVIAVGVPTVISVPAIVGRSITDPELSNMYVTPKNIDEMVKRVSYTISEAINRFFEL
ncbi:MAG: GPR endopeptidase [Wujia sp.]